MTPFPKQEWRVAFDETVRDARYTEVAGIILQPDTEWQYGNKRIVRFVWVQIPSHFVGKDDYTCVGRYPANNDGFNTMYEHWGHFTENMLPKIGKHSKRETKPSPHRVKAYNECVKLAVRPLGGEETFIVSKAHITLKRENCYKNKSLWKIQTDGRTAMEHRSDRDAIPSEIINEMAQHFERKENKND